MAMWPSKEWLASLKVGDEVGVAVDGHWGMDDDVTWTKVSKITPKGQVVVEWSNGTTKRFTPYGRETGSSYGSWYLVQPNDELKAKIAHQKKIRTCRYNLVSIAEDRNHLSEADLVEIYRAIKKTEWYAKKQEEKNKT